MKRASKNFGIYLLIFMIVLGAAYLYRGMDNPASKKEIKFSQFVEQLDGKKYESLNITDRKLSGTKKNGNVEFAYAPSVVEISWVEEHYINSMLEKHQITLESDPPESSVNFFSLLPTIIMVVALIFLFYFMMSQGGNNKAFQFGKNRAKLYKDNGKSITFKDVAGLKEEKEELQEIVDFLRNPGKYSQLGARIPKGVLMVGNPGTGKTYISKATAGEAGVPFFTISGSDFVEMFVGVGASRVRDLFAQAKKNAPCIVFIDEIDAVGRQRGSGLGGGHDEREQTLNQLLVEMDGFGSNEGIITLAATNRPDILDPALLRPGRFDRRVVVGRPDLRGRLAILRVHAKNKPLEPDVDLNTIAKKVPGFTGADLANMLNEAALLAARQNRKTISMADLEEASEKVSYGPERKSHKVSDEERRITAYHESGHAIMATLLKDADPVHKVTIIPRGQAGGYTMMLPHEERSFITKSHLLAQLRVALGGRCAEKIIFNEISSGASGDLQQVTGILRKMIMEWGMSDRLGPMIFGEHQEQIFLGKQLGSERNYGETVATIIDEEMHKYLDEAYNDTMQTLMDHMPVLEAMAQALLEVETIDHKQVENLFKYHSLYAPGEEPKKEDDEESPLPPMPKDEGPSPSLYSE